MISEFSRLITKSDARQWAANYDLNDIGTANLTDWIWDMKPAIGCTFDEHPISEISTEEFWDIIDDDDDFKEVGR